MQKFQYKERYRRKKIITIIELTKSDKPYSALTISFAFKRGEKWIKYITRVISIH